MKRRYAYMRLVGLYVSTVRFRVARYLIALGRLIVPADYRLKLVGVCEDCRYCNVPKPPADVAGWPGNACEHMRIGHADYVDPGVDGLAYHTAFGAKVGPRFGCVHFERGGK